MKSTLPQPQQLFSFSPETIDEILSMKDFDHDGFNAYSRAIDNVFFQYMITVIDDQTNNIGINSTDIFCLQKVKRLLELLQKTANENETA